MLHCTQFKSAFNFGKIFERILLLPAQASFNHIQKDYEWVDLLPKKMFASKLLNSLKESSSLKEIGQTFSIPWEFVCEF